MKGLADRRISFITRSGIRIYKFDGAYFRILFSWRIMYFADSLRRISDLPTEQKLRKMTSANYARVSTRCGKSCEN